MYFPHGRRKDAHNHNRKEKTMTDNPDLVAEAETDQATAVAAAIIGAIRGGVQPQANDVSRFLRRKGIDTEPGQIAAMVAAYLRSWTPDPAELAELAGEELARMRGDTGEQSPEHLARQIR